MSFWRKLVAIISSVAIILLAFNYFSNRHYHILPDGEVVVHSHPYQASNNSASFPGSNHHHSQKQFDALDYTSVLAFFVMLFAALLFINYLTNNKKEIQYVSLHVLYFPGYFHMRAPPAKA